MRTLSRLPISEPPVEFPEGLQDEIYQELRSLAARKLRGQRAGHTLQATALVHEVFIKIHHGRTPPQDRAHFFAVASIAMHQILANHARGRAAAKRGGGAARITLDEGLVPGGQQEFDLFFLNDCLKDLEALDSSQAEVVKMRFFGGMSIEEISHVQGVSVSTVKRDWRMARAWLGAEFRKGDEA